MCSIISRPCRNDKNKCSYHVSSLVPAQFLAFFKAILILACWFCIVDHFNWKNVTIIKCFTLCKGFSTRLSILKCISKWLQMVFEIFTFHLCQTWTLYNTITVPETHKYKQLSPFLIHQIQFLNTVWLSVVFVQKFYQAFIPIDEWWIIKRFSSEKITAIFTWRL